jgi:hypothetical protein
MNETALIALGLKLALKLLIVKLQNPGLTGDEFRAFGVVVHSLLTGKLPSVDQLTAAETAVGKALAADIAALFNAPPDPAPAASPMPPKPTPEQS